MQETDTDIQSIMDRGRGERVGQAAARRKRALLEKLRLLIGLVSGKAIRNPITQISLQVMLLRKNNQKKSFAERNKTVTNNPSPPPRPCPPPTPGGFASLVSPPLNDTPEGFTMPFPICSRFPNLLPYSLPSPDFIP